MCSSFPRSVVSSLRGQLILLGLLLLFPYDCSLPGESCSDSQTKRHSTNKISKHPQSLRLSLSCLKGLFSRRHPEFLSYSQIPLDNWLMSASGSRACWRFLPVSLFSLAFCGFIYFRALNGYNVLGFPLNINSGLHTRLALFPLCFTFS